MRSGAAIVVGAALLAPLLAGCSGSDKPSSTHSAAPTPITRLDPAERLARAPFCDRVPAAAVRQALGATPVADEHWGNGDHLPGGGEIAHEFGCAWTGPSGSAAQAWVLARPTTAEFAQTILGQARSQPGCTSGPVTVFGSPALLQTCTLPGGVERVRRAGLFGDTWLTCEVAATGAPTLRSRTDDWCASVVSAVRSAGR